MARFGERSGGGGNVVRDKFQEREREQRIGVMGVNAVDAQVKAEDVDERSFATAGDFDAYDPEVVSGKAAVDKVAEMFSDDEPMREKIQGRWAKLREKRKQEREEKEELVRSWDDYVGKALAEKEHEVGSMLTEEERSAEKHAELVERVRKKLNKTEGGSKGFGRFRRGLTKALFASTIGMTLFLSACGVVEEPGIRATTKQEALEKPGDGRDEEVGETEETEEVEEGSTAESETETEDTEEEDTEARLQEILEKSKVCDLSEFTPEELELVGEMPELKAKFEASENARVLENNLQVCYDGYFSQNKTAGKNSFGESYAHIYDLDEGRSEATLDAMMEAYYSQPQELAAGVCGFESVLRAAGVSEDVMAIDDVLGRAQAIYDEMLSQEDGGALQARLRGALKLVLLSDQTSFNFYTEDRVENSFYLRRTSENAEESPETSLELMGSTIQRHGAKQVQIVLTFDDHQETMDYNLDCGFQPNWNEHWAPKQAIVEVEVPVVTVAPEEWTTDFENPVTVNPEDPPVGVPEPGPVWTPEDTTPPGEEPGDDTPEQDDEEDDTPDKEPEEEDEGDDTPDDEPEGEDDDEEDNEEDDEDDEEEDNEEDEEEDEDDDEDEDPVIPENPIKEKDPEGQNKVVDEGGQTNSVGETEDVDNLKNEGILPPTNVEGDGEGTGDDGAGEELTGDLTGTYEVTEEPVITPEEGNQSSDEQVGDQNASAEENAELEQGQEEANEAEDLDDMSDEEFFKEYEDFMTKIR